LIFESIYSILEGLINPEQSVKYAGPLAAYLVGRKSNLPSSYDYAQTLMDLRRIIYDKCCINNQQFEIVKRCYDGLFAATKNNSSTDSTLMDRRTSNIGSIIATTNYDMSLELYFLEKNKPIFDGFHDTGAS